jgi:hypothetical protein
MTRAWIRHTLAAAMFAGLFAVGTAFLVPSPAAAEDAAKNLKVLPTSMSKPDIKKRMKKIAAALGVQCDHCHDTDDFSKDTEHKEKARAMMKMTAEINKNWFKNEQRVDCVTCHNGQEEPKKP